MLERELCDAGWILGEGKEKISTTNNWRVSEYAIIRSKSQPNLICVYKHVLFCFLNFLKRMVTVRFI